jgi:rsbT co-antagonist protein RsbR
MTARIPSDDSAAQQRRFRFLLRCAIAIMLLFCANSIVDVVNRPNLRDGLSAATDVALTLMLAVIYLLSARRPIDRMVLVLSIALMLYSLINVLLFPLALLRVVGLPLLALSIAVPYVDSRQLRGLSVAAWITTALLFWLSGQRQLPGAPVVDFVGLWAITGIILLVLNQFHTRIYETIGQSRAANNALRETQASLEIQVAERTASLQQALDELQVRADAQADLLAETEQQRATIRALGVPVLPVGSQTLAVPLVGVFDASRLKELRGRTLRAIERFGARYLVLDVTGVAVIDREVAQGIVQVVQAVRLMGARIVLAGIRPEVAQAIVGLGLDLEELETAPTLQEGIAGAMRC